jgi:LacI family transcriptional regulator
LRRRGIKFDKNRVVFADAFSIVGGAKACRELLDRDVEFTAVFAGNDLIAIGCLETLRDDGLKVPEDVSLAGYNDLLLVDKLNPSLTTVRVPKYEMGVTAARLLLARMRGDDETDSHVKLEPQLIVRQSTGPPR